MSLSRMPSRIGRLSGMLRRLLEGNSQIPESRNITQRMPSSTNEAIAKLPTPLHGDATKLSTALKEARSAISLATLEGSDHDQRTEAFNFSRNTIHIYNELVDRGSPHIQTPSAGAQPILDSNSTPSPQKVGNFSDNALAKDQLDDATRADLLNNENTDVVADSNQINQSTPTGYYKVPTIHDATADEIVNSPNPVVRAFGPHIADLKYDLYMSRRQRIWIGWNGWF